MLRKVWPRAATVLVVSLLLSCAPVPTPTAEVVVATPAQEENDLVVEVTPVRQVTTAAGAVWIVNIRLSNQSTTTTPVGLFLTQNGMLLQAVGIEVPAGETVARAFQVEVTRDSELYRVELAANIEVFPSNVIPFVLTDSQGTPTP